MKPAVRFALIAALTAASRPLAAQSGCVIDLSKPFQITSALLYVQRHDQQADTADKSKALRQAVKTLTDNPQRIKNEPARNFVLGLAYIRWFQDQGAQPVLKGKRSDVGFADNADGEFSLPQAMHEAMAAIEREVPQCADSTLKYRNAIFGKVLNASIAQYNAKQYETAIEWANAALVVSPKATQTSAAYQVLTNAYLAKGDVAGAVKALSASVQGMGTDPSTAAARAQATFQMALLTRDEAQKRQGDERSAGLKRAAALFKDAADLAPEGPNAATARALQAKMLQDAGEGTAAVVDIYADMKANPSKYTALQLFEGAVVLANSQKLDEAAALYEAGLAANPFYRDALFNVANVYFALHQPEKMGPVVDKLRGIDPMNPDVLKLAGAVWQERGRTATAAPAKKAAQDSTSAYLAKAEKLPARVLVTQFTVGKNGAVSMAGTVENRGAAAASFTVMFEFVDKQGNGVGSGTAVVEGVAPKESKPFTVQATGANPVAWRYTLR